MNTNTPKPETDALNERERKLLGRLQAAAETLRQLPPDRLRERVADFQQEIAAAESRNPNVRAAVDEINKYFFRACLHQPNEHENRTMTNETPISRVDRETAARINPYISDDPNIVGTCGLVAAALRGLSHMIDVCQSDTGHPLNVETCIQLLQEQLETLAGALEYEFWQYDEPKPEEKEPPVKRVK